MRAMYVAVLSAASIAAIAQDWRPVTPQELRAGPSQQLGPVQVQDVRPAILVQEQRPAPAANKPPPMNDPEAIPRQAERNRILLCNAEATSKNLKGREHRAFVSQCLSGDSSIGASRQPAPGSSAQR